MPSQLAEIAQRFQPDVEDLEVLLQEEGLPVGSAECLQQLSARLASDPRFHRDVAFLVRSMLGRSRDEPGSMDVLGVLVAAAGTRHDFASPSQQQAMRELLRFVIQQRRSAPATAHSEPQPAPLTPIPAPLPVRGQQASPTPPAPQPVAVPSLVMDEPEPLWKRAHAGWIVAMLAVLIALGAGLAIWRGNSAATTPQRAALATTPPVTSASYPAAAKPTPASTPERPAALPPPTHLARRPAPSLRHISRRHAEPTRQSTPSTVATNTPPRTPARTSPPLDQPFGASTAQPYHPSTAVSASANSTQQPSDIGKAFAHPEAAAAQANDQVPPPAFHHSDPVLIARNHPPAAPGQPALQGTVHMGSTGNMASNLVYSPAPDYPAAALAAHVAGEVTVRAVVGPDGNVIDARVVSGPPLLREAALQCVGRWRYRPYEQGGKPMAIATTAIFDFRLPPRG